ncbi:MAG: hypothetical protein MJZ16_09620, partial [Bacteroidales bacterium]|nr:hypothetical protein [Bacteroidales bacterium]
PVAGGDLSISVTSNVDYTVAIEEESKSWISIVTTKVGQMRTDVLDVTVSANNTPEQRVGSILLVDAQGATVQTIAITQESGAYTAPAFADDNFKAYILKNFDKDGDGEISSTEAAAIETINYADDMGGVTSWAGVEAFYNLKNFTFSGSSYYTQKSTFESLDLTNNKKLENLSVLSKTVKTIDLSGLTLVKTIQVGLSNNLENLKFDSLKELKSLIAYATALTSVDLSGCPELSTITLYDTKITSLDLSCCPKAETVSVGTKTLASLNINGCNEITSFAINNALMTEFDFSALTKLTKFNADYTAMTVIDLSNSPLLTSFNASNCAKLSIIDVSKASKLSSLTAYSNNALTEIRVAEGVNYSSFYYTSGHWNADETYTATKIVVVPSDAEPISDYIAGIQDEYVKKFILKGYDKNNDGKISAEEAAEIKELDLSDFALTNVDGLSTLPALEKLNLSGNKLTTFDGADFKALVELDLKDNALTKVALKSNKIKVLDLSNNKLSGSLDYSNLPSSTLVKFNVSKNAVSFSPYNFYYLESLDMSNTSTTSLSGTTSITKVKYLNISNTKISGELNLSSLNALETLDIRNTDITTLNVSGAITSGSLKAILADGSKLSLVKVGSGNELPEGLVQGVENVMVQNFTSPTQSLKTNEWGYITEFIAGEGATASDFTVNYTEASSGFVIDAGGQASIKVKSGKKVVKFFALGVNGAPQITLERSSGKVIYTKSTDSSYYGESYKSSDENPFTVAENASATKNQSSYIVDGNSAYHFFNLSAEFSSATSTEEGEEIIFKVSGKAGEKVILLGINMSSSRSDDE